MCLTEGIFIIKWGYKGATRLHFDDRFNDGCEGPPCWRAQSRFEIYVSDDE